MIMSHRSGLGVFKHQFAWDTECLGYPEYRSDCAEDLVGLSLGEFLKESVTFDGRNFSPDIWRAEPDKDYHYSVAGYQLLKYVIARVSGQSYADYMRNNLFAPLHMDNAGFYLAGFEGQHALPHTYVKGEVIELPLWEGNGDFMRMTATDLAKFQLAHLYDGSSGVFQMIKPETVELMRTITTRRNSIFNRKSTLYGADFGLGIRHYDHGWMGLGGSVPGYLCIWRYNPDRHVGYAFLMNVNSILMGGDNSGPVTESYVTLKNTIENRLAPTILFRGKIIFIGALVIIIFAVTVLVRKRSHFGHNRV
jgi:CubicO group peptidase (beta-lactamase class C family)